MFHRGTKANAVISLLHPIQKIRRRIETRDALHGAAFAVDRVLRVRIARTALRADGQRQMSARAAAGDAEMIRIDIIFGGVVAHKANGAVDIALDFGDGVFGLRTMHHREHGIAAFEQWLIRTRVNIFMGREKAATDHPQDADAVGFRGLKNIHRQRRSVLARVNDVLDAGEIGFWLRVGCRDRCKQYDQRIQNLFHGLSFSRGLSFLIPRRYRSNQSANISRSSGRATSQPWPWPSFTTSFAVAPASCAFATKVSDCWMGTSVSLLPCRMSVGGMFEVTK